MRPVHLFLGAIAIYLAAGRHIAGYLEDLLVSKSLSWAYARLELTEGSSPDEVRRAYRALIRKYHPDMFSTNPELESTAEEVSKGLTEARNAILSSY